MAVRRAGKAALALSRAQATQVYAGLKLWPAETMARLAEAQLIADGTYPNAAAAFAGAEANPAGASPTLDYDPAEPRDLSGRWTRGGTGAAEPANAARAQPSGSWPFHPSGGARGLPNLLNPIGTAQAAEFEGERDRPLGEVPPDPTQELRNERYGRAVAELRSIDPNNPALDRLTAGDAQATEEEITSVEQATRRAKIAAWRAEESRSERRSPLELPPERPRSELERYYGHPHFPGPFEAALYPEIEAGPEGLTIEPEGRRAVKRGDSYEDGIVEHYDFAGPDDSWEVAGLKPDAIAPDTAIEVKYTDDFSKSIYNPERGLPFADKEVDATIEQAMRYAHGDPPRRLIYYTNDWTLAEYYTRAFRGVGLSSFRFIIVPATRKPK